MLRFTKNFILCQESRLIFQKAEKASEVVADSDKKKGKEVIDEAARKAREKAISEGKAKAASPSAKPGQPSDKPLGKPKMPEIPTKITGLRFDLKDAKAPTPPNGTIEQPFQFGDLKMKGKIIFPEKPDNGPDAKTTYVFNYVDDPEKFDHSKFLEKMKDKKANLGNTVIITLRTPEGETKVNQEKVNTMEKIMADVEKYQADLSKDSRYANVKIPRATDVFHMTSYADMEKAKRTNTMLANYVEKLKESDSRWLKHPTILDTSTPETLATSLDTALAPPAQPEPKPGQNPGDVPIATGGGGTAPKYGGGGGMSGGGSGGSGGNSGGGGGQPSESASGDSSGASNASASPGQSPAENKESGPGVNKLLVIGDSLMVGVKNKLRANLVEKSEDTVKGGRQLSEMLSRLKNWDKTGKLEAFRNETMVIDGGTNDLGRLKIPGTKGDYTKEAIFGFMKDVWQIAKKYNIKVYQCALPPFGGTSYSSLNNNYEEREAARKWINAQMRKAKEDGDGPAGIIELDLPKSKGGLASEPTNPEDLYPNRLAAEYRAGDGIHFTGAGNDGMAAAIQKAIGEPASSAAKESAAPNASLKAANSDVAPGKVEGFKVTPSDRQAADDYLAEVNATANPSIHIGESKPVPGSPDKILKVAWHSNHSGQWGTPAMKILPGRHVGVQVEPNRDAQKKSLNS